jgi:hypothetical protein
MDEEFIYMGEGGARVPLYAVHVVVDICIAAIPAGAFLYHTKLMDVAFPPCCVRLDGMLSVHASN